MGHVEVDELGVLVIALAEGDGQAHLAQGSGGTAGHPREWPGGHELVVGHLKCLECLHGEDVEAGAAIDEGLRD